jgi:Zn-dependent M28 family amino/carboxypeptidase
LPVAQWLERRLRSFGYRDVTLWPYEQAGARLVNVVCVKPAAQRQRRDTILLGAHFDSRMEQIADATARAPGASDNASGVAVLLEVARLLAPVRLRDAVRFVLFSGEEQGLWGSAAYAAFVKSQNVPLRFVFNLDQTGWSGRGALQIDRDEGGRVGTNDAESRRLVELMQRLAKRYISVPTRIGPAFGSDYVPFEARGYPIVGLYEGQGYPHYHKTTDTPDRVDVGYVTEAAKLTLATLLHEAAPLP